MHLSYPLYTWKKTWLLCVPQKKTMTIIQHMAVCQNLVPLVNIKIAGKWMFIPLKMVLIGIDPYPYCNATARNSAPESSGNGHGVCLRWIVLRKHTFKIRRCMALSEKASSCGAGPGAPAGTPNWNPLENGDWTILNHLLMGISWDFELIYDSKVGELG